MVPKPTPDLRSDPLLRDLPEADGVLLLDRRYEIEAALGRGGMGAVYRASHRALGTTVAIKILDPALSHSSPEAVTRFQREASAAERVRTDSVVQVRDVCEAHGLHYIVMEFVDGENARERVQRKGGLDPSEAITIALGTAQGLAAAHAVGLVHRDVKPDNILIAKDGQVKLADLGLAKDHAQDMSVSLSGRAMGTPRYMPPEQFLNAKAVGPAADVYSLGATLYFLLTGRDGFEPADLFEARDHARDTPFPDPRVLRPEVGAEVATLVERCTRKDPADRPQSAQELLAPLALALGTQPTIAEPRTVATEPSGQVVSPPPTVVRVAADLDTGRTAPHTTTLEQAGTDTKLRMPLLFVGAAVLLFGCWGAYKAYATEPGGDPSGTVGSTPGGEQIAPDPDERDQTPPPAPNAVAVSGEALQGGAREPVHLTFPGEPGPLVIEDREGNFLGRLAQGAGEVSIPIPFNAGIDPLPIPIAIRVRDAAGNTAIHVLSLPVLPRPRIEYSNAGHISGTAWLREPTVPVVGRVWGPRDTTLEVLLDGEPRGEPLTLEEDGLFRAGVALPVGINGQVSLRAAGAQDVEFRVIHDPDSPEVELVSPKPGMVTNDTEVGLILQAFDAGLAKVELNGEPAKMDPGRPVYWESIEGFALPLEGRNTIVLEAWDMAGNPPSRVTTTVLRDTQAPTLVLSEPAAGSTVGGEPFELVFEFDEVVASVRCLGKDLTFVPVLTRISTQVNLGPDTVGPIVGVPWRATDRAGNVTSGLLTFKR